MKSSLLLNFSVDKENRKIRVQREFSASLSDVWTAWTESELLDQWWAPKPWKARTKTFEFREGGHWLYAMVGPDGEVNWCRADYKSISVRKSLSWQDAFCDETGKITDPFPKSLWMIRFSEEGDAAKVSVEITYSSVSDLEKIIEMGFKEGFSSALENLDEALAAK